MKEYCSCLCDCCLDCAECFPPAEEESVHDCPFCECEEDEGAEEDEEA